MSPAFCPSCGMNLAKDELIERDGFCIDPRGAVSFEGRAIRLTAGEVVLLHTVAAANGRPVKRLVVGDRVSEQENPENCASVLLHRIRRRLADAGAPCPIQTVHGRGYRWTAA